MVRRRWFASCHRYPKTTQERRANQDRFDPYVRGARRRLPHSYDDLMVGNGRNPKSWKTLGRRKQYREDKNGYEWREFRFDVRIGLCYRDHQKWMMVRDIMDRLEVMGCFWEWISDGIRWFGPEMIWE